MKFIPSIVTSYMNARKAEYDLQIMEADTMRQLQETFQNQVKESENSWERIGMAERDIQEDSGMVNETPMEGGWQNNTWAEKGHVSGDQWQMILAARKFFRYDPNARAAIWNMVKYIIGGKGIKIKPKSSDPAVRYVWHEFWAASRNKMIKRQFEIVWRTFRDGECFLQYFNKDDKGAPTWKTTVRFRDPVFCRAPVGEQLKKVYTSVGVEVDAEDVETPIAYWFVNPYNQNDAKRIDAAEIQHLKIYADSDQKRGETFLQPVMRLLTQHRGWLENRMILNKMRTAIVLIRKMEKGTQSDVTRLAATLGQSPTVRTNDTKSRGIVPGTIYNCGPGVDMKMESANINAGDVAEDGRNVITRIACGVGQPEHMFGDASNANYSSSMVAESPFVKEVQFWQLFFREEFREMFRRVIRNAVEAGVIDAPPSDDDYLDRLKKNGGDLSEATDKPIDTDKPLPGKDKGAPDKAPQANMNETEEEIFYGCDIEFPEIIHRNLKEMADALTLARNNGWVSDPEASALFGFEYTEEVRKQQDALDQAEVDGNPLMGIQAGDGEIEAEANAGAKEQEAIIRSILSDLTPADRERLLQSRNLVDFINLMQGKDVVQPDPGNGQIQDDMKGAAVGADKAKP